MLFCAYTDCNLSLRTTPPLFTIACGRYRAHFDCFVELRSQGPYRLNLQNYLCICGNLHTAAQYNRVISNKAYVVRALINRNERRLNTATRSQRRYYYFEIERLKYFLTKIEAAQSYGQNGAWMKERKRRKRKNKKTVEIVKKKLTLRNIHHN